MKPTSSTSFFDLLLVAAFTVLLSSGCSDIKKEINDLTGSDKNDSDISQTLDPEGKGKDPGPPEPEPIPEPEPPTAEELIAAFKALKPSQISDGAIANVTSNPESAAAINEIEIVGIDGVTGNGLRSMAAMPNLHVLKMNGIQMTATELGDVSGIKSLKELDISGTNVTDDVIASYSSLSNLESINLKGTRISAATGASFAQLPNLAALNLEGTTVDDSTIAAISQLPIRDLNLARSRITSASIPVIGQMKNLESLDVSFCQVVGASFKGFSKTGLKKLNVGETNFGIDGFVAIKGMRSLEELNVYRSGLVQHKKCDVFRSFTKLKILNAGGNPLTNDGMKVFFKGHRSLEDLYLSNCKGINDQGLAELIGVKTLKVLNVSSTGCTRAGAIALKQRLDKCKILTSDGTF